MFQDVGWCNRVAEVYCIDMLSAFTMALRVLVFIIFRAPVINKFN